MVKVKYITAIWSNNQHPAPAWTVWRKLPLKVVGLKPYQVYCPIILRDAVFASTTKFPGTACSVNYSVWRVLPVPSTNYTTLYLMYCMQHNTRYSPNCMVFHMISTTCITYKSLCISLTILYDIFVSSTACTVPWMIHQKSRPRQFRSCRLACCYLMSYTQLTTVFTFFHWICSRHCVMHHQKRKMANVQTGVV